MHNPSENAVKSEKVWKYLVNKNQNSGNKGKPMTVGSFVKDFLMILWEI